MDGKIEKGLVSDTLSKNKSIGISDVIMLVAVTATAIISLMTILASI